jgi:agmatine/peptidylarginine deiminase
MLGPVERVFTRIVCEISLRERVLVVVADTAHEAHVAGLIATAGGDMRQIALAIVPSNDTWARDHGPVAIQTATGPTLLNFTFNGWGGKYPAERDNRITGELATRGCFGNTPVETADMVLEGGSIDSNGAGTLLTTRRCLPHPRRNPTMSQAGIEARLRSLLGVQHVLWLEHGGLAGDDTDSHIDTLARFTARDTIIYQSCTDAKDENYFSLKKMAHEVKALRDTNGQPFKLIALPSPRPIHDAQELQLPASYANFLVINNAVLVPAYDDPADEVAREAIGRCFPDRETVMIDCLPLIHQFGSLHCVTMQLAEGIL